MAMAGGPVDPRVSDYREIAELKEDGELSFALLHVGYVGTGFEEQGNPIGYSLLKHRSAHLLHYIMESMKIASGDIYACFRAAFKRMDEDLQSMVASGGWETMTLSERALWTTHYNSVVVMVDHKLNKVHIGGANRSRVLLARRGEEIELSEMEFFDSSGIDHCDALAKRGEPLEGDKYLRFYKQAKFKRSDDYIIVASLHNWRYIRPTTGSFVRVLESRIPEVGLEEACNSMVGLFPDEPKSIIAVPLNQRRPESGHQTKKQRLSEEESDSEGEICHVDEDLEAEEDEEEEEMDMVNREWCELHCLKPWDGNNRPMDAATSIWYSILPTSEAYPEISRDPRQWGQKRTAPDAGGLPSWAVGSMWKDIAHQLVAMGQPKTSETEACTADMQEHVVEQMDDEEGWLTE